MDKESSVALRIIVGLISMFIPLLWLQYLPDGVSGRLLILHMIVELMFILFWYVYAVGRHGKSMSQEYLKETYPVINTKTRAWEMITTINQRKIIQNFAGTQSESDLNRTVFFPSFVSAVSLSLAIFLFNFLVFGLPTH